MTMPVRAPIAATTAPPTAKPATTPTLFVVFDSVAATAGRPRPHSIRPPGRLTEPAITLSLPAPLIRDCANGAEWGEAGFCSVGGRDHCRRPAGPAPHPGHRRGLRRDVHGVETAKASAE